MHAQYHALSVILCRIVLCLFLLHAGNASAWGGRSGNSSSSSSSSSSHNSNSGSRASSASSAAASVGQGVRNLGHNAAERVHQSGDHVRQGMQRGVEHGKEQIRNASERAHQSVDHARQDLHRGIERGKEQMHDSAERIQQRAAETTTQEPSISNKLHGGTVARENRVGSQQQQRFGPALRDKQAIKWVAVISGGWQCGNGQKVIVVDIQPLETMPLDIVRESDHIHLQSPNGNLDGDFPQGRTAYEYRVRLLAYQFRYSLGQARMVSLRARPCAQ